LSPTETQRAILAAGIAWMDAHFDADANLLRHPGAPRRHAVRESLWYAAGLFAQRGRAGAARAARIVDAVLLLQYDRPGSPWDGTWPRVREEPAPGDGATMGRDYDPNWRQFVGCVLGVLVRDHGEALGEDRSARARDAIARATRGESGARITPGYTNIALMQAWLLCEHGDRARGERLAGAIEELHRREGGLHEFNSPTYYGVDLWGLALWRRSASASLAAAGKRLESALWRDIATFYHPGLRNLCGPYDRAYGMDMTHYASLLGLWLWWGCGDASRAFPDTTRRFDHAHDFCAAPLLALAPPSMADEVRVELQRPVTGRTIARRIGDRTITATLTHDLMLGAVDRADHDPRGPAVPITAHWIDQRDGRVAWLCIRGAPLSGVVTDTRIALAGEAALALECPASSSVAFAPHKWRIGGRRIEVTGIDASPARRRGDRVECVLTLPSGEGTLRFA
jgi:hypothetical protein